MKKFVIALVAVALATPSATIAGKPDHAARPDSGTGCIVREAETAPYAVDAECEFKSVVKYNKDGSLQFYHYQDKGNLQDGQVDPERAVKISLEGFVVGGLPCTGTEVITPSGGYASNLKCN